MKEAAALILFSGGQDSSTVLAWALSIYDRVETIGFKYGQKHSIELERRLIVRDVLKARFPNWSSRLGADHVVDLNLIGQIASNIIPYQPSSALPGGFSGKRYVPGRNLIMLSMSASVAFRRSIATLGCGVSETEYSGYPDCRRKTIVAAQVAIRESSGIDFKIEAPLMDLDKAGVWELAYSLGGDALVDLICEETHTCYLGARNTRHAWGYGCGDCDACRLREKGWVEFIERRVAQKRE